MIQFNNKVTIIEGDIISSYIKEFKNDDYDKGFDIFSNESIIYALLEYSKFPRPYTKLERIAYIYDKCVSFSNNGLLPNNYSVELELDYDDESWFIKTKNKLPF